ncbi:ADP-ribosylglycohydrolase family protein [Nocardiopsis kunsanensis]|uniref:ADP-ribosylglycohydrolase family protein n=1 Tax=Nocardiopsis kunsanensis TaxID=141693 RepID=UPI000344C281|nr:ADP-ribosylglycohydrolase family protein [Nocardiopsis kunsanensis]
MPHPLTPTTGREDRAAGVLLAAACGDALGVPYEFAPRLGQDSVPGMIGGGLGPYAPGEYSDDTQMAVCIARALAGADGLPLRDTRVLDAVADHFLHWRRSGATDIGNQTRAVLDSALETADPHGTAAALLRTSRGLHRDGGRTAGNGSLMRTGPVALHTVDDAGTTAESARLVSDLTHADPLAGDACVIWCEGIRHAVVHGTFDGVRAGVGLLPAERRADWNTRLDAAESAEPHTFGSNGFVVTALQAAWSAITRTPLTDGGTGHLRSSLEAAVRAGDDTDTVAAIAGSLLGARWGASAVPDEWYAAVHGWEELTAGGHVDLALRIGR